MSLFPSTPRAGRGDRQPDVSPADRATLTALVRAGADLAEPRHVVYYSYAGSAASAQAMADAAAARGFLVDVRDPVPTYPDQWAVVAETVAVADSAFIAASTDFFTALAAAHGAEYDGWEASV